MVGIESRQVATINVTVDVRLGTHVLFIDGCEVVLVEGVGAVALPQDVQEPRVGEATVSTED